MIGYGQDAQCLLMVCHRSQIKPRRLHFNRHQSDCLRFLVDLHGCVRIVEEITRVDRADGCADAHLLRHIPGCLQHAPVSGRCHMPRQIDGIGVSRVCRRTHRQQHVAALHRVGNSACGSNPYDRLNPIEGEKLMRIQRQGRNAHAGAHDRNLFALKQAGVSQHSTDIIEQYRILQIMLSDILRAERITRHQHNLCYMRAILYIDTRRRRNHSHTIPAFPYNCPSRSLWPSL